MDESIKKRIEGAINNYVKKNDPNSSTEPKRKNEKPEKEVEKAILQWAKNKGWFINKVESKAIYSKAFGNFHYSETKSGTPDLLGCNSQGVFVAIEVKAPGKRSTLRENQRAYLLEVIARGGFAYCCDNVETLNQVFSEWLNVNNRKAYLLNLMPKEKESENKKPLFMGE